MFSPESVENKVTYEKACVFGSVSSMVRYDAQWRRAQQANELLADLIYLLSYSFAPPPVVAY